MRISRLRVHGFGKLQNQEFELCPGINLFLGDNESGKSTLQQAFVASLFGFYDYRRRGRPSNDESEAEKRYEPWDRDAKYGCAIDYELDDGSRYRLERTFAGNERSLALWNIGAGEDIGVSLNLDRYAAMQSSDQQRYIGVSRDIFLSSACVDQGKLLAMSDPHALSEAMTKSLDSNEADVSAKDAVARIEKARKDDVGSEIARTKPLAKARQKLLDAQGKLREWDKAQQAVADDVGKQQEIADDLARLRDRLEILRFQQLGETLAELGGDAERLEALDRDLANWSSQETELSEYADFPAALRDDITAAIHDLRSAQKRVDELEDRQQRERNLVASLKARLAHHEDAIGALEALREFPGEREDRFYDLRDEWTGSMQRLREVQSELAEQSGLQQGTPAKGISLPILAGGAAVALAAMAIGVVVRQLLLGASLAMIVLVAAFAAARRWGAARRPEPQKILKEPLTEAARAGEESGAGLVQFLESAGVNAESLDEGIGQFERKLRAWRRLQEAQVQARNVRRELDHLESHTRELQESIADLEKCKEVFRALVSQAGIGVEDPEEAYHQYEAGYEKHSWHAELKRKIDEAREQRRLLLRGRTPESLHEERDRLRARRSRMLQQRPGLADTSFDSPAPPNTIDESIRQIEADIHELDNQLVELRTRIEQGLPKEFTRAEVEEQIAECEREVARLERFGKALELARDHIVEAAKEAREDFVPQLNEKMSEALAHITAGRYDEVAVSLTGPDIDVVLLDPDMHGQIGVAQVSLGTREQCYLCLRMAIATMLSGGAEKLPLMLDDPFVNFDDPRLERMLEFVANLAREHQILLFTKDRLVANQLQEHIEAHQELKVFNMPGVVAAG